MEEEHESSAGNLMAALQRGCPAPCPCPAHPSHVIAPPGLPALLCARLPAAVCARGHGCTLCSAARLHECTCVWVHGWVRKGRLCSQHGLPPALCTQSPGAALQLSPYPDSWFCFAAARCSGASQVAEESASRLLQLIRACIAVALGAVSPCCPGGGWKLHSCTLPRAEHRHPIPQPSSGQQ